jgi:1,6-anhydro-N-acetylmuramate kinase
MSDDITAAVILETQLREARAEAAGYRADRDWYKRQRDDALALTKSRGEELGRMAAERDALRASHAELVAALEMMDGERLHDRTDGELAATKALANARKVVAP